MPRRNHQSADFFCMVWTYDLWNHSDCWWLDKNTPDSLESLSQFVSYHVRQSCIINVRNIQASLQPMQHSCWNEWPRIDPSPTNVTTYRCTWKETTSGVQPMRSRRWPLLGKLSIPTWVNNQTRITGRFSSMTEPYLWWNRLRMRPDFDTERDSLRILLT